MPLAQRLQPRLRAAVHALRGLPQRISRRRRAGSTNLLRFTAAYNTHSNPMLHRMVQEGNLLICCMQVLYPHGTV